MASAPNYPHDLPGRNEGMDDDFYVKRAARTIVHQGWGALFDSEVSSMRNKAWRARVMLYVEKYERQKMLDEHGDLFKGVANDFYAEWPFEGGHRVAQVWRGENSFKRILEIKEYADDAFHAASEAGAHDLILRRELTADGGKEGLGELIDALESFGCPRRTVLRALSEAD